MKLNEETVAEIIHSCESCGKQLNNLAILNAVEYAKKQISRHDKPVITVVCSTITAMDEVWNSLTSGHLSDYSISSDKSFSIKAALPETEPADIKNVLVSNAPILNKIELNFIYSPDGYMDVDWQDVFVSTDCLFLTLNAVMLLTRSERQLIEKLIHDNFGYTRLYLLLSGVNLIQQEEDVDMVYKRLEKYSDYLGEECTAISIEDENFRELTDSFIPSQTENLHNLAIVQAVSLCMKKSLDELHLLKEATASNAEMLISLQLECEKRAEMLRRHGRYAAADAENEISVNLYYNFQQALAMFRSQLIEKAESSLDKTANESLDIQAQKVQVYVEQSWKTFINEESSKIQQEITNCMEHAYHTAEQDATDALLSLPAKYDNLLENALPIDVKGTRMNAYPFSKEYKTRADRIKKISNIMLVGAIPALIIGPAVTLAIAASSLAIRKVYLSELGTEELSSIKARISDICSQTSDNVAREAEAYLKKTGADTRRKIQETYNNLASRLTSEITNYISKVNHIREHLSEISELEMRLTELQNKIS